MQKELNIEPYLVKAETIAKRYNLPHYTIYRWARKGKIPSYRLPKRIVRFNIADVDSVLAKK